MLISWELVLRGAKQRGRFSVAEIIRSWNWATSPCAEWGYDASDVYVVAFGGGAEFGRPKQVFAELYALEQAFTMAVTCQDVDMACTLYDRLQQECRRLGKEVEGP